MRHIIIALSIIFLFAACKKEPESVLQLTDCFTPNPYVQMMVTGINNTDSVLVTTYEQNTGFGSKKEQKFIKLADEYVGQKLFTTIVSGFSLKPGYDYEMVVPKTNDTFRISGIHYTDRVDSNYFNNARTRPVVCEDDYGISSVSHNGKEQGATFNYPDIHLYVLTLKK